VLKPFDGKTIEQVLGANQLGIDPGYQNVDQSPYQLRVVAPLPGGAARTMGTNARKGSL